jgi:hypothetical protein
VCVRVFLVCVSMCVRVCVCMCVGAVLLELGQSNRENEVNFVITVPHDAISNTMLLIQCWYSAVCNGSIYHNHHRHYTTSTLTITTIVQIL